MKKILTLLMISIFLLSACQPTETAIPTEPVTEEPTDEPTEEPTEEDTETPTGEPTEELPEEPTQEPSPFEAVINLELVAEGLIAPVAFATPDDGSGRLFIVDQIGLIHVVDSEGTPLETPFLDLQDNLVNLSGNYDEKGLLGLAFHPDYANNGRFYVYYSAPLRVDGPDGWNHTSILSEFRALETDANSADPESERIIMEVDQPQGNHNAGAIAFGPDGYLYIPLGDGGGANDVGMGHVEDWYELNAGGNAQNLEDSILGSVLRIDIDNGDPYAIPEDNPDLSENYPEIWAYGFRNPYRMAFDSAGNNELFLGDAGQNLWEEVSIVESGGNYGWNVYEGTDCFSTDEPGNPDAITECPTEDPRGNPLIDPIIEFANITHPEGGLGTVIIGGVVYRGSALPAWDGRYVFGQWSTSFQSPDGGILVATRPEQGLWDFESVQISSREGGQLDEYLLGFGQDQEGEVYVLTSTSSGPSGDTGRVYRIAPPGEGEQAEEVDEEEEDMASEVEIAMVNLTYQPEEITISVGTTVTWVNEDNVIHNVITGARGDPNGLISSPDIEPGASFSFTFEEPGTYDYYCSYHLGMSAVVIVE